MKPLRIVTCALGAGWEGDLVAAASRGHVPADVVARCLELGEVHAALRGTVNSAGPADAVLVDAASPWIDALTVADLRRSGTAVVVVGATDVDARALHFGADGVLAAPEHPAELIRLVLEVVTPQRPAENRSGGAHGRTITVWSAKGAPGRSTLAVSLAWELAKLGVPTRLVDLDTYAPSIAILLGLSDSPGVGQLVQRIASGDTEVSRFLQWPRRGLGVAVGTIRSDAWLEVPDHGVELLLRTLVAEADVTVVDVDDCTEDDEELRLAASPWRRNQATLAALGASDLVLVPVLCDPVSVHSTVRALTSLRREGILADNGPPRILSVLSRVTSAREAGDVEAYLADAGIECAMRIPDDPRSVTRARWAARVAGEVAPRSVYAKAVARLAGAIRSQLATAALGNASTEACAESRARVPS